MHLRNVVLAILVVTMVAFAQTPVTEDTPFQVNYIANLAFGESYVNITNSGALGAPLLGPAYGPRGNICVNVYAFTADEQLISCCSCRVTPNGLVHLSAYDDLVANALTPGSPLLATRFGLVIKLVATAAGGDATGSSNNCTRSAASLNTLPLATGMVAWRTTVHNAPAVAAIPGGTGVGYNVTESQFVPATLSGEEIASISGRCAAIIGNASGYGICGSCLTGALGAAPK